MAEVKQFPVQDEYMKGNATPQDVENLRQWLKTQPHLPDKYITGTCFLYYCELLGGL